MSEDGGAIDAIETRRPGAPGCLDKPHARRACHTREHSGDAVPRKTGTGAWAAQR